MELYLMKDQTVKYRSTVVVGDSVERESEAFPLILEPLAPECKVSKINCQKIVSQATGVSSDKSAWKLSGHKWQAVLTVPDCRTGHGTMILYEFSHPEKGQSLYQVLTNLFKKENLSFHLIIKDLDIHYSCNCKSLVNLESKDPSLAFQQIKFPEHELHCEATIKGSLTSQCRMTLIVNLNEGGFAKVTLPPENPTAKYKHLLDDTFGSDLVIVAGNGAEIKTHKCHLMESSEAFRSMFKNEMKDGIINCLEMPDMSEAGVRAFLIFIYTSDVEAASGKCEIALELFQAGDKYGMASLKNAMKKLICSKPAKWFSRDTAIRLSLIVQNLEEKDDKILKKMTQVLKFFKL